MRHGLSALLSLLLLSSLAFSQAPAKTAANKNSSDDLPKLDKFDPALIDKSKNACVDFYQYTCSNWIAAHPISPDLPLSSTVLPLFLYNQTILRDALEKAAADKQATGSERQIGDYWESCMNESVRNADGKSWLQPSMATIATLKSNQDLPRVVAYLHLNFPSAWLMWNDDDNYAKAPLFGFGPAQDLADASKMVAGIDQGGMALPSLDYYLNDSDHFKEIRAKYLQHIQKMFELAGDPSDKAAAEAKTVLEIEDRAGPGVDGQRDPARSQENLQQDDAAAD